MSHGQASNLRRARCTGKIHRFNKAQQDALLRAVEEGPVTLTGARTENPELEVNAALLVPHPGHLGPQEVAPDEVAGTRFYEPDEQEAQLRDRLQEIREARGQV